MDFKRLRNLIILSVILSVSLPVYAKSRYQGREMLANYGFSYCVYKHSQGQWIKRDAGATVSVYFQLGSHSSEAYSKLEKYILTEMSKKKNKTNSQENSIVLYQCLEIYQSKHYKKFLHSLDKYM